MLALASFFRHLSVLHLDLLVFVFISCCAHFLFFSTIIFRAELVFQLPELSQRVVRHLSVLHLGLRVFIHISCRAHFLFFSTIIFHAELVFQLIEQSQRVVDFPRLFLSSLLHIEDVGSPFYLDYRLVEVADEPLPQESVEHISRLRLSEPVAGFKHLGEALQCLARFVPPGPYIVGTELETRVADGVHQCLTHDAGVVEASGLQRVGHILVARFGPSRDVHKFPDECGIFSHIIVGSS